MTKGKVNALVKMLNVQCDQAFMFVCKVGKSGAFTAAKASKGGDLFNLLINMIDKVMEQFGDDKEVRTLLVQALLSYLDEEWK